MGSQPCIAIHPSLSSDRSRWRDTTTGVRDERAVSLKQGRRTLRPGSVGQLQTSIHVRMEKLAGRNMDPTRGCPTNDIERQRLARTGQGFSNSRAGAEGRTTKQETAPSVMSRLKLVCAKAASSPQSLGARTSGVDSRHRHTTKMPGSSLQR